MPDIGGYKMVPIPASGAWRVHPAPGDLPRLQSDGPGLNRFDDPHAIAGVRYVAETLRGCLVETMARFRSDPHTEALLAAVTGADDQGDGGATREQGLGDWLEVQRVAIIHPARPQTILVDVEDATVLVYLNKHPDVRAALDKSGLGTPLSPVNLDAALIRLGGPIGRPITQAVSTAVRDWLPEAGGVAYWSRLDPAERCWGLWQDTAVSVTVFDLSPTDQDHLEAVRSVASLYEIALPTPWN